MRFSDGEEVSGVPTLRRTISTVGASELWLEEQKVLTGRFSTALVVVGHEHTGGKLCGDNRSYVAQEAFQVEGLLMECRCKRCML